jgi:lipoprotein signal peptidase
MHKKVFGLILIDQITKLIFSGRDFFLGPIHIHTVKNYALAFSLDFGMLANLILIIGAVVFFAYYYFTNHRQFNLLSKTMFALIFAGAISNLLDLLYLGYVRDFIDLGLGFTFNLADAFLAAGLIGFLLMYRDKKDHFQNDF